MSQKGDREKKGFVVIFCGWQDRGAAKLVCDARDHTGKERTCCSFSSRFDRRVRDRERAD